MKTKAKTVKLIRDDDHLIPMFSEKEILTLQSSRLIRGGDGGNDGGGVIIPPPPPPPPH
jgi:hypothetical protein